MLTNFEVKQIKGFRKDISLQQWMPDDKGHQV